MKSERFKLVYGNDLNGFVSFVNQGEGPGVLKTSILHISEKP